MALPKSNRVLRSAEFRSAYRDGVRVTSRYFAAFCLRLEGEAGPARFGFTVPRALGKAVDRNRLKRRMRGAVQEQLNAAAAGWAIVFNPRRGVLDAPFEELCREVGKVLTRCR